MSTTSLTSRDEAAGPASVTLGRAALALAALGVVFGDIGTSPLYALRECFRGSHAPPLGPDAVLGILSLLLWSLLVIVAGKYVSLVMRVDNRGEGGILALLAVLRASPFGVGGAGCFSRWRCSAALSSMGTG